MMEAFVVRSERPSSERGGRREVPLDVLPPVFGRLVVDFFVLERNNMRADLIVWAEGDVRPYLRAAGFRGSILFLSPKKCEGFEPLKKVGRGYTIQLPPCNMDVEYEALVRDGFFREVADFGVELVLDKEAEYVPNIFDVFLNTEVGGECLFQLVVAKKKIPKIGESGASARRGRFQESWAVDRGGSDYDVVYTPVIRVVGKRDVVWGLVDVFRKIFAIRDKGRGVLVRAKAREFVVGTYGFTMQGLRSFMRLTVSGDSKVMFAPELRAPPPGKTYILPLEDFFEQMRSVYKVVSGTGQILLVCKKHLGGGGKS